MITANYRKNVMEVQARLDAEEAEREAISEEEKRQKEYEQRFYAKPGGAFVRLEGDQWVSYKE
jgi:hypothetical protein